MDLSLPAARWNSTSHGHLPGLSETDSCQIPLPCSSISNRSWYIWFWLDEMAVVVVGSSSESLGKLPKSCGLTVFTAFTLYLLLQLYSLFLPFLHPTLVPDRALNKTQGCKGLQFLSSSQHLSIFHFVHPWKRWYFVFVRPGCLAQFPKLVVSSSKLTVVLAPSPAITCDQSPGFLRQGQKYHNT